MILLLWLARTTDLIRDPGPPLGPGQSKPYNLGRTQMAFWFFLIYMSYMVIWLITNNLDTITPSLLVLMGISAGTALSDAVIDSGKASTKTSQLDALTAEKQTLEQRMVEINTQLADIEAKATAHPPTATPTDLTTRDELNKELPEKRARLNEVNRRRPDAGRADASRMGTAGPRPSPGRLRSGPAGNTGDRRPGRT